MLSTPGRWFQDLDPRAEVVVGGDVVVEAQYFGPVADQRRRAA